MIEPVHRDLLIGQQFLETPKSEKRIHRLMRLMGIRRGFLYLAAIVGWHTRKVLS